MNNNKKKTTGCRLCADDRSVRHTGSQQKKRFFLENCTAAVTMQWQNQLFHGPTQKFKKALSATDKLCCKECIISLHAPYALSGREVVWNAAQLYCIFTHNSQDFSAFSLRQYVHWTEPEHNRLWVSCGTDTALTDLMPPRTAHSSPHEARRRPGGGGTIEQLHNTYKPKVIMLYNRHTIQQQCRHICCIYVEQACRTLIRTSTASPAP